MDSLNGVSSAQFLASTDASNSASSSNSSSSTSDDILSGLSTDSFLQLMIAQLQNQDPLNPTDNNELMQQISDIRNIGATDELTTTLNTVATEQNLTAASALIGKSITGLSDSGDQVNGTVDSVTLSGGTPVLNVGNDTVSLNNISSIVPSSDSSDSSSTSGSSS